MGVSKLVVTVALAAMLMVVMDDQRVAEAITCEQVTASLSLCFDYLRGGAMTPECCSGVRGLSSLSRTIPDKKQACICLKQVAATTAGLNYGIAAGLPQNCGLKSSNYRINPTSGCSSVEDP